MICTVDAVNGDLHLDLNPESTKQVAAADAIVLTKTDVAQVGTVDALSTRLRNINPSTRFFEAPFGNVDPNELLRPGWSPDRVSSISAGEVNARHVSRTYSTSLTFDGPVDWVAFGIWIGMLLHARGEDVLRVQGLLNVLGEVGPVLLNGVQHVVHPTDHLEEWPDEDHRSRVVFITRGIRPEELLASLEAFRRVIRAGPRLLETNTPV